jgi:hypothetical protein
MLYSKIMHLYLKKKEKLQIFCAIICTNTKSQLF